jgi:pimeloyl-ACP methyl ester carboxylesterase
MFSQASVPRLIERVANQMSSARESVALAALEATWNHGRAVPALLAEIRMPVVSINATSAFIDVDSMNRHGVRVLPMKGVGHFPMLEKPAEFNACLGRAVELVCQD